MIKARLINSALLCISAGVLLCSPLAPMAHAQQKRVISGGEGLPFSDGIVMGNTLYISGQQGTDEHGKLKAADISHQTQATLENIARVVKQAGFQLSDIVAVNVYLADINDFAEMNKVYKSFLPDPKPTRTTVQAAGLVNHAKIEISAIAVKEK
ncbi:MAG TPA: RidA family protein [Terriglobales bacterium]|nr:RidA family protein [Terriglobales bacterium]